MEYFDLFGNKLQEIFVLRVCGTVNTLSILGSRLVIFYIWDVK